MIGFIVGVIGAILIYRLYIRVADLERTVKTLQSTPSPSQTSAQIAPHEPVTAHTSPDFVDRVQAVSATTPVSPAPNSWPTTTNPELRIPSSTPHSTNSPGEAFINWLRQDVFLKLGALLLLIAFGWFVSYAFANNWIGPMGRIALGLLMGTGIMALGVWRIERYLTQGAVFLLLGSSAVLLTTYAARDLYDFFTPASALLLMAIAITFVAYNAVAHQLNALAVASVVLGGVAPLLVASSNSPVLLLLCYLLILVLGTIWILAYTRSTALLPTAFIIVALYTVPHMSWSASLAEADVVLVFGFVFGTVFLLSNCVSMVVHERAGTKSVSHVLVGVGTGLYLAAWIASSVAAEWQVLVYLLWSVIFAGVAFAVYIKAQTPNPFYVHGAVSLGFLTAATAAMFTGPALTLAFTIEIAVLILLTYQMTKNYHLTRSLSWLFAVPILLSLDSFVASSWSNGILHADFFILSILALVMAIVGVYLQQLPTSSEVAEPVNTSSILAVVSSLYGVALVWLVAGALLPAQVAIFTALLVYTILGLGLYFHGLSTDARGYRLAGGALIALVMVRLLFIDVWYMELTGRIITFAVIGILLISTAFISKFNQARDT